MEKLSWLFELVDRMSGPARKIAAGLGALPAKLASAAASSSLFQSAMAALAPIGRKIRGEVLLGVVSAATATSAALTKLQPVTNAIGGAFARTKSALADTAAGRLAIRGWEALRPVANRLRSEALLGIMSAALKTDSALARLGPTTSKIGAALKRMWGSGMRRDESGQFVKGSGLRGFLGGDTMKKIGGGLATIGKMAVQAAGVAAIASAGLAAAGGSWVVSSLAFRENTLGSLEAMLKSKSAAEDVFTSAVRFAAKTPFSTSEVAGAFERLIAAGFQPKELEKVMTRLGDFAGSDAEKLQSTILVLSQIRGKGKLQGEELMQLAERGMPLGKVLEQLAKTMNKTTDEVQALLSAGKIKSDVGIGAVLEVMNTQFGGRMEKAANSLSGLWSTLKSVPEDILFNPKTARAMEPAIESLKAGVKAVTAAFAPDTKGGQAMAAVFVAVGEALGWMGKQVAKLDFSSWVTSITKLVDTIRPKLAKLFEGIGKSINWDMLGKAATGFLDIISKHFEKLDPETLVKVGESAGWLIVKVVELAGALLALSLAIGRAGLWLVATMRDVAAKVVEAIEWISAKWNALKASLGFDVKSSLKLDLIAPSTGPGATGAGAEPGILDRILGLVRGGAPMSTSAIGAQPTLEPIRAQGNSATLSAAQSQTPSNQNFNLTVPQIIVNVEGVQDGAQVAQQAAGSFTTQLGAALKQLGASVGR